MNFLCTRFTPTTVNRLRIGAPGADLAGLERGELAESVSDRELDKDGRRHYFKASRRAKSQKTRPKSWRRGEGCESD